MCVLIPIKQIFRKTQLLTKLFNFVFALKASIEMISVRTGTRGSQ
jgi:hypothetical protein